MTLTKGLFSSNKDNWETPQKLFDHLDSIYHFDLDAASDDQNSKCKNHFTVKEDGLKQKWGGHTVFVNPPYGRQISDWVKKAYEESYNENTVIVMLVPARTDTKWFHDYIYHTADEIKFIRGRLRFEMHGIPNKSNAPFPSMIVVYDRFRRKI